MENKVTFAQIQEEIANMLDVPDEELTDEQRATMGAYLDELGKQEASKVDSFASFIRRQLAIAEAMKEESAYLENKAKAIINKVERFKSHYLAVMQYHDLKKIAGDKYSIAIRENTRVEVTDIEVLKSLNNPEYLKTEVTYKPDKKAIKDAMKLGGDVPGCVLAKSYSLNIR